MQENPLYLTEQIITYIGNKRTLLSFIGKAVEQVRLSLNKDKLDIVDIFSGSGIVSRYMKQYANVLYANDLEGYAETINHCYLSSAPNRDAFEEEYLLIKHKLNTEPLRKGFISELYCPQDDNNIKAQERVFYTQRNGQYIDTTRQLIDELKVPDSIKPFILAPLLYEASVHTNTAGIFKGFYKDTDTGIGKFGGKGENALTRIKGNIELQRPIFSNFDCEVHISRKDANELAKVLPKTDLVYLDPPYNQHPYGSNYFMLNLINDYQKPTNISKVSGIPNNWNRSVFNKKAKIKDSLGKLCATLDTHYLLISFSDDGFISVDDMVSLLSEIGKVSVFDKEYNTFRGCRNLQDRDVHVKEYLYLVKK